MRDFPVHLAQDDGPEADLFPIYIFSILHKSIKYISAQCRKRLVVMRSQISGHPESRAKVHGKREDMVTFADRRNRLPTSPDRVYLSGSTGILQSVIASIFFAPLLWFARPPQLRFPLLG
jgi:hypothetical protein